MAAAVHDCRRSELGLGSRRNCRGLVSIQREETMSTVYAPAVPLYNLGFGRHARNPSRRRFNQTVPAPRIPLHQLGWLGRSLGDEARIVATSAPIAATLTTAAVSSAAAGTAWGAAAGPIGAAVGAVVGIVAGLLAAHEARVKGAKNENAAVDSAVPTFDQAVQTLVQAYNAGQIDAGTAAQQIANIDATMFQTLKANVGAPGTAWSIAPKSMNDGSGAKCDKSCTVGCCVYNDDLHPAAVLLYQVFNALGSGGKMPSDPRVSQSGTSVTVQVPGIASGPFSSYTRGSYSLTLTPPPPGSAASLMSSLSGGGSLLPLLILGGLAFVFLK
jgi:hypothetical protein